MQNDQSNQTPEEYVAFLKKQDIDEQAKLKTMIGDRQFLISGLIREIDAIIDRLHFLNAPAQTAVPKKESGECLGEQTADTQA